MNKYQAIKGVWDNLEEQYLKKGTNFTRLEFMKQLLSYDKGDAGKHALLKCIYENAKDVPAEEVEVLCSKIETAYKNIGICEKYAISIQNLDDFCKPFANADALLNLTQGNNEVNKPAIEMLRKVGSLLPVSVASVCNGRKCVSNLEVPGYYYVGYTEPEVVQFLTKEEYSVAENRIRLALLTMLAKTHISLPIVVMDEEAWLCVQDIAIESKVLYEDKSISVIKAKDKLSGVRVIVKRD